MMALVQLKASPAGLGIEFSRCVYRERQLSTQFEPSRKIFPHTALSPKGVRIFILCLKKPNKADGKLNVFRDGGKSKVQCPFSAVCFGDRRRSYSEISCKWTATDMLCLNLNPINQSPISSHSFAKQQSPDIRSFWKGGPHNGFPSSLSFLPNCRCFYRHLFSSSLLSNFQLTKSPFSLFGVRFAKPNFLFEIFCYSFRKSIIVKKKLKLKIWHVFGESYTPVTSGEKREGKGRGEYRHTDNCQQVLSVPVNTSP